MRIIAGRFRGRPLTAPKGLLTRPTTDRVREALFQILGDLSDLSVADIYAGTGALGLEALSRGARHVTFVEPNRQALAAIQKNLERLGMTGSATVVPRPAEQARAQLSKHAPLDLVLADPPWRDAQQAALVVCRVCQDLLAPAARVVLGHPASAPVSLPENVPLKLVEARRWGGSGLSFFEKVKQD